MSVLYQLDLKTTALYQLNVNNREEKDKKSYKREHCIN